MMDVFEILNISVDEIAKYFSLLALGIYVIFALVVVRQVQLMTDTVEVGFEKPIKFLSLAHLVFAIFVLLYALRVL